MVGGWTISGIVKLSEAVVQHGSGAIPDAAEVSWVLALLVSPLAGKPRSKIQG
jgi:hypothetical protein